MVVNPQAGHRLGPRSPARCATDSGHAPIVWPIRGPRSGHARGVTGLVSPGIPPAFGDTLSICLTARAINRPVACGSRAIRGHIEARNGAIGRSYGPRMAPYEAPARGPRIAAPMGPFRPQRGQSRPKPGASKVRTRPGGAKCANTRPVPLPWSPRMVPRDLHRVVRP